LIDKKQVVKLTEGVVLSKKAYDEMVAGVQAQLAAKGKLRWQKSGTALLPVESTPKPSLSIWTRRR